MAISNAPPKPSKNSSKKNKKSWRKNADIKDVEDYLEDRRLEERLGGSFSDRPNEVLFTLDTKASEAKDKEDSALSKIEKWRAKPLKCFMHLENDSAVLDPKKGRNRRKTKKERENPIVQKIEKNRIQSGRIHKKKQMVQMHKVLHQIKAEKSIQFNQNRRRVTFDFDLWENGTCKDSSVPEFSEWIKPETQSHTLKNTRQIQRQVPHNYYEKTSKLPAVELPLGGSSYNPSLEDHQEILWKAAIIEIDKEKERLKIERKLAFVPSENTEETEIQRELSEPEDDKDDDKEKPKEVNESESKIILPKPKTKKIRRQEKERRISLKRKTYNNSLRDKNLDIFRLKSIKKELTEAEKRTELRRVKHEAQKKTKLYEPKTLSSMKYIEPEIAIKLSDELTGNLRSLKPEGSILEDRFKSLQKRNIIETRVGTSGIRKRKKRKVQEKRSYKMPWELKQK